MSFEIPRLEPDENLVFEPKEHKYFWKGKEMISVTTLIDAFSEPFDVEGIATTQAEKKGVTTKEIIKLWETGKKDACKLGNEIHNYCEELMNGKSKRKVKDEKIMNYRHSVNKFFAEHLFWIPVGSEIQVCLPELEIAGMVDALFYDVTTSEYILCDWKTSKSIKKSNYFGKYMLEPLHNFHDCNYNKYSLQLYLYKYMLETIYGIEISKCYIIHLREDGYNKIQAQYFEDEIQHILN